MTKFENNTHKFNFIDLLESELPNIQTGDEEANAAESKSLQLYVTHTDIEKTNPPDDDFLILKRVFDDQGLVMVTPLILVYALAILSDKGYIELDKIVQDYRKGSKSIKTFVELTDFCIVENELLLNIVSNPGEVNKPINIYMGM